MFPIRAINRIPVIKGLYAITPDCSDTQKLLRKVRLACEGGAAVLQYRNKTADQTLRLSQALALRKLTHDFDVPLIINDDAHLALQADADGVHLGEADESIAAARAALGPGKIIGVSCYNYLSRAQQAVDAGADYVAFGAFFPSTIKPGAVAADIELLYQAHELGLPRVAIGGITLANATALIEAGADALAVITALFDAEDIRQAARDFSKFFSQDFAS